MMTTIRFRYTRITYEDAFPEGDDLSSLMHLADPDHIMTFQVHFRNFKLQNFNNYVRM
jgi:hypothetical protein